MKMKKFEFNKVDLQPFGLNQFNEELAGATHVETYTKPDYISDGDRILVVFAFYPDGDEKKGPVKAKFRK